MIVSKLNSNELLFFESYPKLTRAFYCPVLSSLFCWKVVYWKYCFYFVSFISTSGNVGYHFYNHISCFIFYGYVSISVNDPGKSVFWYSVLAAESCVFKYISIISISDYFVQDSLLILFIKIRRKCG